MRPSILPAVALALILVGAGAFGAWFVLSQEEITPPPVAALPETPEPEEKPAPGPAGVIDSPAETVKPQASDKVETPKPTASETPKKADGANSLEKARPPEESTRAAEAARLDAARAALEKAAGELPGLGGAINPEDLLADEAKVPFSATISGTVTDNKGAPVAGAGVYADVHEMREINAGGGARMAISTVTREASPKGTPIATSMADGSFTAQISRNVGEKSSVNVQLTAKADGFAASRTQGIRVKNGEHKEGVKLSVRGAGTVSGRVVEQSGRGVEGVTVSVSGGSQYGFAGDIEIPVSVGGGGAGRESAVTDSAGNFTITGVAEGRYRPTARGNGWRQVSGPSEVNVKAGEDARLPADFVMNAATHMKVKLTDADGKPVMGYCTVTFKEGSTITKTMGAMTASDGSLSLNDVPVGTFAVEISGFNFKSITLNGTFTEGQPMDLGSHTVEKTDPKSNTQGIFIPGDGG